MIDLNTKIGRKAKRRLKDEQEIWMTTVGADGAPHPRPVWFYWDGQTFVLYSQTFAYKVKHIAKNKSVALNLNSGSPEADVVVFHGTAEIDENAPASHMHKQYFKKYKKGIKDLKMTPEEFSAEYCVAIRVTPHKMRVS